ncbi:unnamed protein product [Closterium sp. Yama58-4]|nr:unnamed protein product [Closterium sp. Yama58-4]
MLARLLVTAVVLLAAALAASAYGLYSDEHFGNEQERLQALIERMKAEENRLTQQQTTTGSGHQAGATDKGTAVAQSHVVSSISSYLTHLPAALSKLLPSAVNTYIVGHIMHCLHQQLLAARTALLKLKKRTFICMAHIMHSLHQHSLAVSSALLKLKKGSLDFTATQGTSVCQAVRHVFAAKPVTIGSTPERTDFCRLSDQIDNLTAQMNSKMNGLMLLLQAVKREVEAGSRVKQEQREPNQGGELKGGQDELVTPGMGERGVHAPGMWERLVQAEVQEEGRHRDELSESGKLFLEEVVEEYSREMEELGEREEREEMKEVEITKGDVERLRNEVAGRVRVEEEGERDMNILRREVEVLKCGFGDARKCMEELRDDVKAEMAVLRREVEVLKCVSSDVRKCPEELRAELKTEMAVLVAQRERRILDRLDELRDEMYGWRREVEEGRVVVAERMREVSEEVDTGKAEVARRLIELQQRLDERKMEAIGGAATTMDDGERVEVLSARLESFRDVATRVEGEIQALWEAFHSVGL